MTTLAPSPARTAPEPPVAKRVTRVVEIHGERLVDDYFWLRDKADPDVRTYLEAENAYTTAVMKPTEALQSKLYDELLARIQETDMGVPWRKGGFLYYSRTEQGKQYPIYCRKAGSLDAPEQVVLDMNALAIGESYMAIGAFAVTDDANLLAYTTDVTGFRQYTLSVKDLRTGTLLPLAVERVTTVAWAKDNVTLFYAIEHESTKRAYRLYRHRLGTDEHELVLEEADEAFNIGVGRTRSGEYLVLGMGSHTTSEFRVLPAGEPTAAWQPVAARVPEQEYDLDHRGDVFWIRANDTGRNFRIVTAPIADPRRENWTELVAHRSDVMIEGIDLFRDHAVVFEREGGLTQLRVIDLRTMASHRVAFPEQAYAASPGQNEEWEQTAYRYVYESFITPRSVFDYDMDSRAATLLKEQPVLGGYDRSRYAVERIHAVTADGVRVPISLVHRKDLVRDGRAPIFLSGYGAYGIPNWVSFTSNRFSLVDRGVVVAIAHIRGGGEMGKPWHDDGRMLKKRNTFSDFIAAAEHLLAEKYGAQDRLVIQGGSAGGLLMGAVTEMRPDLFRAVVSKVPFLDVVNSMLDESLPLTVGEFEEWGNPKKKDEYDVIRSYCPYSNLKRKAYPAILITTSFNDSQVMYWEPAKYVAKLRTLKTDSNPLLLKTNMAAGHGGASGRYDYLREVAFDYAFVLWQTGLDA